MIDIMFITNGYWNLISMDKIWSMYGNYVDVKTKNFSSFTVMAAGNETLPVICKVYNKYFPIICGGICGNDKNCKEIVSYPPCCQQCTKRSWQELDKYCSKRNITMKECKNLVTHWENELFLDMLLRHMTT